MKKRLIMNKWIQWKVLINYSIASSSEEDEGNLEKVKSKINEDEDSFEL